jgi:hypothetical protein
MWAKQLLHGLAYDKTNYPRIPAKVRGEAKSILRHYPMDWDMEMASIHAPDVFQPKMDPLVRMMKSYDIEQKEEQKEEQNDKAV